MCESLLKNIIDTIYMKNLKNAVHKIQIFIKRDTIKKTIWTGENVFVWYVENKKSLQFVVSKTIRQ